MDNKTLFNLVVNGTSTSVEQNNNAPLKSIIGKALEQTGNTGQPQENWEVRDEAGNVLDLERKIGEFGFADGVKLFISLKTGVAG
ncbi:MAG: DUF2604 domain-containing protein [Planctomycetota bacterium]